MAQERWGRQLGGRTSGALYWKPKQTFGPSVYRVFCQSDGKLSNIPGIPAPEFCRSWIWTRVLVASQNLIVGVAQLPEKPTSPTPWTAIDVW